MKQLFQMTLDERVTLMVQLQFVIARAALLTAENTVVVGTKNPEVLEEIDTMMNDVENTQALTGAGL